MFQKIIKGSLEYFTIPSFEETGLVRTCFSTKRGGVSRGVYESMNLRFQCDDDPKNVRRNFEILTAQVGASLDRTVLSNQVHEDHIHVVEPCDFGNGLIKENAFQSADGLMTDQRGCALITLYADCVPLLFLDPVRRVIASVHSGWRGTVQQIGKKAVEKMQRVYRTRPEELLCAIGPSIGVCCYEVSDDVAQQFKQLFGDEVLERMGHKYHVNMQLANEKMLLSCGVRREHITKAELCTCCHSELLFSHRATNGNRGNLAAVLMLR